MGPDCTCGLCQECRDRAARKQRTAGRAGASCGVVLAILILVVFLIVLAFSIK
jgi:hypothetical protein